MGSPMRSCPVPAAWLRGPRAGAFVGAARAVFATVCRSKYAGMCPLDAGADVSCAQATDAAALQKAPHLDDAEESAAARAVGLGAAGIHPRRLRDRHR